MSTHLLGTTPFRGQAYDGTRTGDGVGPLPTRAAGAHQHREGRVGELHVRSLAPHTAVARNLSSSSKADSGCVSRSRPTECRTKEV